MLCFLIAILVMLDMNFLYAIPLQTIVKIRIADHPKVRRNEAG